MRARRSSRKEPSPVLRPLPVHPLTVLAWVSFAPPDTIELDTSLLEPTPSDVLAGLVRESNLGDGDVLDPVLAEVLGVPGERLFLGGWRPELLPTTDRNRRQVFGHLLGTFQSLGLSAGRSRSVAPLRKHGSDRLGLDLLHDRHDSRHQVRLDHAPGWHFDRWLRIVLEYPSDRRLHRGDLLGAIFQFHGDSFQLWR